MVIPMPRESVPPPALLSNAGLGRARCVASLDLRSRGGRKNGHVEVMPPSAPRATESRPQNVIFPPNWNWRAVPTIEVIWPAVATGPDELNTVDEGRPKFTWFVMLNPSSAQLQTPRSPEPDVLEERSVQRRVARADDGVPSEVANRAGRREREAVDVEPLVRIAEHWIRRAAGDEIRPLPGAARPRQRARPIEAEDRRQRHAGMGREDAGQLPAGCQSVDEARGCPCRTAAPTSRSP